MWKDKIIDEFRGMKSADDKKSHRTERLALNRRIDDHSRAHWYAAMSRLF